MQKFLSNLAAGSQAGSSMATGGQVLLGGNRSSSAALRTLLLLCSEVRTVRARVLCSSSSGTHGAQPAAQSGSAPGGRRVPKSLKKNHQFLREKKNVWGGVFGFIIISDTVANSDKLV